MMLPSIHMNGTSRENLLEGYCDAITAIDYAMDAIRQAGPNGRDYYPQGPNAMAQAGDEHLIRLQKLTKIREELNTLAEHCS